MGNLAIIRSELKGRSPEGWQQRSSRQRRLLHSSPLDLYLFRRLIVHTGPISYTQSMSK